MLFFIYSIKSDATAVVPLHMNADANYSSSLDWSSIMHVVSLIESHEGAASPAVGDGRKEGRVRMCVDMEGEQRKAIPLKTTNSVSCRYLTIT